MKSGKPIKIIPGSVPITECIYIKHGSAVGIKAFVNKATNKRQRSCCSFRL